MNASPTLPSAFQSPETFRTAFEQGLEQLLMEHGSVGVFILVLANAAMDETLHENVSPLLHEAFNTLRSEYRSALIQAQLIQDAPDDTLVFLKLMATGLDHLHVVERRDAGQFELQLNPLRSLRPARNAAARIDTIQTPFNPKGFHFNKPFLKKEVFWQGDLLGKDVRLLYNKFPFLPLHGLLVPEPEKEHSQKLTQDMHQYLWKVTGALSETLPGVGFGYNAYGASASVNHLHFQMFLREESLPVTAPHWQHNGGDDAYPSQCITHSDPDKAWQSIADLHDANQPYNLIYAPGRVFILPRPFQGSPELESVTGAYAFYEMAGGLTTFNRDDFEHHSTESLFEDLAKHQVNLNT